MISIKRSSGEISTVAYIYRFVDYCLLARVRDWLPGCPGRCARLEIQ